MRPDGGQEFHGDPLVTSASLIIGTDSSNLGLLYAFDRASGELQWKVPIDSGAPEGVGFTTDLLGYRDSVIAAAFGDYLASFDLATGELRWEFDGGSRAERRFPSSPALVGDAVYFGTQDGALYALDAATGSRLWKETFSSGVSTAVVTDGHHVFFGTADRVFYKVDPLRGTTVASITLDQPPAYRPLLAGDSVFVIAGEKLLIALDSDLREQQWSRTEASDWDSPRPRIWRGWLIVGTGDGRVLALNPRDGTTAWSFDLAKGRVRGIGSDLTSLYVGTIRGHIAALRVSERRK